VDIPLNDRGIAQARAAAPMLRNRGITTIVSSPLGRARVTAEIVAAELGLPIGFDEELREVSFGTQEGKPMAGAWFGEWVSGQATPEGAESFVALRARAVRAINRALVNPATVLIVAHGALFRALRAEMGLEPNVRTANAVPFLCEPATPWNLVPGGDFSINIP
jgi:probable phosphoglycerate mutase